MNNYDTFSHKKIENIKLNIKMHLICTFHFLLVLVFLTGSSTVSSSDTSSAFLFLPGVLGLLFFLFKLLMSSMAALVASLAFLAAARPRALTGEDFGSSGACSTSAAGADFLPLLAAGFFSFTSSATAGTSSSAFLAPLPRPLLTGLSVFSSATTSAAAAAFLPPLLGLTTSSTTSAT